MTITSRLTMVLKIGLFRNLRQFFILSRNKPTHRLQTRKCFGRLVHLHCRAVHSVFHLLVPDLLEPGVHVARVLNKRRHIVAELRVFVILVQPIKLIVRLVIRRSTSGILVIIRLHDRKMIDEIYLFSI
jgi:hypothetical protein